MVKLLTLGWACLDQRFYVGHFPPRHSRTPVSGFRETLGGPAAVGAWTIARLGGEVRLLSRRGSDALGERLETFIKSLGVQTHFTIGQRSPISGVLVEPSGERHIFPYPGELPEGFDFNPEQVLQGVRAVFVDYRWTAAAMQLAKAAKHLNIPVVLDLDRQRPEAWELVPHCSHVVASEEMAQQAGGVKALFEQIPGWAAVTLGARGVVCREGTVEAFKVEVKDTTGAGDVFHGAFALALAEGMEEVEGLRFSAAVAALHVQNGEPPNRTALDQLLNP
jgi:sulfofructose kinase